MATAESGAGYNLSASEYKGGPFGVYAFLDAFNPWDIIKAIGRGFRWAVVGRRVREQDVSYQPNFQAGTQLQDGPAGAMGITKGRLGSYERLDGEPDESAYSKPYDPYTSQAPGGHPGGKPGPPLGPGRMGMGSTEAFAAAPLSRPGNAAQPVQGGDMFANSGGAGTEYHGAAAGGGFGRNNIGVADGGELKMPEEADYRRR